MRKKNDLDRQTDRQTDRNKYKLFEHKYKICEKII